MLFIEVINLLYLKAQLGWMTKLRIKEGHKLCHFLCIPKNSVLLAVSSSCLGFSTPSWSWGLISKHGMPSMVPWLNHSSSTSAWHRNVKSFLFQLLVKNMQLEDGKMIPASQFFKGAASSALELTEAELAIAEAVRVRGTSGMLSVGQVGHRTYAL